MNDLERKKKLGSEVQEGGTKCILKVSWKRKKEKLVDGRRESKTIIKEYSLERGRKLKFHGWGKIHLSDENSYL